MANHSEPDTGAAVRNAMKRARVSQRDLAAHLRISQAAVSRRVSGSVEFTVSQLRAVAVIVDVPVEALMGEPAELLAESA